MHFREHHGNSRVSRLGIIIIRRPCVAYIPPFALRRVCACIKVVSSLSSDPWLYADSTVLLKYSTTHNDDHRRIEPHIPPSCDTYKVYIFILSFLFVSPSFTFCFRGCMTQLFSPLAFSRAFVPIYIIHISRRTIDRKLSDLSTTRFWLWMVMYWHCRSPLDMTAENVSATPAGVPSFTLSE